MQNLEVAQRSRYLLRALLREATYLPDQAARKYIRNHVLDRFRAYAPNPATPATVWGHQLDKSTHHNTPPTDLNRTSRGLKLGRKALRQLTDANNGSYKHLQKVLFLTYGRIGKRRYALLQAVREIASPQHYEDPIVRTLKSRNITGPILESVPKISFALEALIQSQRKVSPPETVRKNPKNVKFDFESQNIWHRRMPITRVKNMACKWHAVMLDKTHAPLPGSEWERLKRLVTGMQPWKGPLKRRISVVASPPIGQIIAPALSQELGISPRRKLKRGSLSHKLTSRYMRRMWETVFAISPKMTWDPEKTDWNIEWGLGASHRDLTRLRITAEGIISIKPAQG